MLKKANTFLFKSLSKVSLRSLTIRPRETPNPNFLKFVVGDKVVMKEGTMDYVSAKYADNSPLAQSLFSIEGITRVFYGGDHIAVGKQAEVGWEILKEDVIGIIEEFYNRNQPLFTDEPILYDTSVREDDSEVVAMIKEILETRVRPLVQEDGGDIVYKSFDENTGIVLLLMKGSCAGCPSSGATLKGGIERMLKHYIPEVQYLKEYFVNNTMKVTSVESEDFEGEAK